MPVQAAKSIVLFDTRQGLQRVGFEYLYLLLGLRELGLTVLCKFQTALVRREGLFQGQLPRFHAGDKLFQLGQRGFETERLAVGGGWLWRLGHICGKTLQNEKIAELCPASQIKNTVKL